MDIVLSLLLFFAGVALFGVAAWQAFYIRVEDAVERSSATTKTTLAGFFGITFLAAIPMIMPPL